MKKTWIKVKRGLIEPKHRERLGIRIWLYLYILDQANWERGAVIEWTDKNASDELEIPIDTIRSQRRRLVTDGYIVCHQSKHSQTIEVRNWTNPREYSGEVYNEGNQNLPPCDNNKGGNKGGNKGIATINTPTSNSHITDHTKKKRAKRDPIYDHPAVRAYREVVGKSPVRANFSLVIDSIGESPDIAKLKRCWQEWNAHGFKPNNINWVRDWYRSGIPDSYKPPEQNRRKRVNSDGEPIWVYADGRVEPREEEE